MRYYFILKIGGFEFLSREPLPIGEMPRGRVKLKEMCSSFQYCHLGDGQINE